MYKKTACFIRKLQCDVVMWITHSKILIIFITVFGEGFGQRLLCYVVVRITHYKKIACFISWVRRCYRISCKKIKKSCKKIVCFIRKLQCDVVVWITNYKWAPEMTYKNIENQQNDFKINAKWVPKWSQNGLKMVPKRVPERVPKFDVFWERVWEPPGILLTSFRGVF